MLFNSAGQGFKSLFNGSLSQYGYGRGFSALYRGFGSTAASYSAHAFFKFALYDVFKHELAKLLGKENTHKYRDVVYLTASAGGSRWVFGVFGVVNLKSLYVS